jgi:hypothetical protein
MKVYMLTQADIDRLLLMVDRDPKHGHQGGSSQAQVRDPQNERAHDEAHSFYAYQVRSWVDSVKGDK